MKPKLSKAEIKESILKAAIIEFSQHGFLGASTKGIAERAGLNKSQLHYYIEDKETLYADVLSRLFKAWEEFFTFDQQTENNPADILKNYIEMKLKFAFNNPELSRIFTSEVLSGATRLEAFWPDAMHTAKLNISVIESWVTNKKIRPLDGKLLLMNIWALTQYYADYAIQAERLLEHSLEDSEKQQDIITEVTNFILLGCGIPAE
ncbi:MAG: TetR family transcriptional regulator C-terminal domain-containing protein [Marinomonas sp.]